MLIGSGSCNQGGIFYPLFSVILPFGGQQGSDTVSPDPRMPIFTASRSYLHSELLLVCHDWCLTICTRILEDTDGWTFLYMGQKREKEVFPLFTIQSPGTDAGESTEPEIQIPGSFPCIAWPCFSLASLDRREKLGVGHEDFSFLPSRPTSTWSKIPSSKSSQMSLLGRNSPHVHAPLTVT